MPDIRQAVRRATWSFTLMVAAALTGPAGAAQSPPPSTTLHLVLRTGPNEQDEDIVKSLKRGLAASSARYEGEPTIRSVSPAFFEEFSNLVAGVAETGAVAPADAVGIRRLASREALYELALQPGQVLTKVAVSYKSGAIKTYTPSAPGEKAQLQLTVPGRYAFTPEPNDTPIGYEATVSELGKPPTVVKQPWPQGDKYYVVTLRKFQGDKDLLFAKLKDKDVVPNPFDVRRADDLVFAFANLNSTAADTDDLQLDGQGVLNMTVEDLKGSRVKRVWVYFPLDAAGLEAAIKRFRGPGMKGEAVAKAVREESVPAGADLPEIAPDTPPKWYEHTPSAPTAGAAPVFSRKVRLTDFRGLVEKYPQVWKLVVWEFDDGANSPEAIRVNHPKLSEQVYVLDRELLLWKKKVSDAASKAGGKK